MAKKAWYQADESGRIVATAEREEFAVGMQPFEFPDDFDFTRQGDFKIVDGELVEDGAWTQEQERERAESEFAARQQAQLLQVARMQVAAMDLTAESDDAVASVNTMLPDFVPEGREYEAGDSFLYGLKTYRVAQAHTSQPQWVPGETGTESLYYEIVIAPDGILVWRQPTGAHDAPGLGAERHYPDADGPVYVSKREGNTSVPGADEWWEAA